MNFLDKLTKTATNTYKYTQEKTSKITKIAKLKSLMNEDKQKIDDLYNEIGKEVYENHIREEKVDIVSKIEEICKEIDVYADEIELTRMELLKLKDLKQCKKCSYEMELDFRFCPSCGELQDNENKKIEGKQLEENTKNKSDIINNTEIEDDK